MSYILDDFNDICVADASTYLSHVSRKVTRCVFIEKWKQYWCHLHTTFFMYSMCCWAAHCQTLGFRFVKPMWWGGKCIHKWEVIVKSLMTSKFHFHFSMKMLCEAFSCNKGGLSLLWHVPLVFQTHMMFMPITWWNCLVYVVAFCVKMASIYYHGDASRNFLGC